MSPATFNASVTGAMVALLLGGLQLQGLAVARGLIGGAVSRKFAHVTLGLFLTASWSFYRAGPLDRWIAALVPAALLLYFVVLGLGTVRDESVVRAGSRSGRAREFLHGPVYYVLSLTVLTVICWRTSPVGIAAIMIMVVGDGLGEVAGKSISSPRIPWNRDKSVAGSATVLIAGWAAAAALTGLFTALGYLGSPWGTNLLPLAVVALVGAVVESLPIREVDNLTIPAACAVAGYLVLL